MKRLIPVLILGLAVLGAASAQTTIDKPAATVKLTKPEMISVRQFKANIDKIESTLGQKLTAEQRKQLLDKMVDELLFFQYCEQQKIVVSDAEVANAVTKLKANIGPGTDDAKLELALRSQGITLDGKTYARQQLLLQAYFQKSGLADQMKSIPDPTSEDVLQAYELYKSQLIRPDTVRVSVIYVDLRQLSAEDKKKNSDALRQVAAGLKSNPAKFDEYVLKASDAGSLYKANANFYVEKTPQSQATYGNAFVDTVFKMKAGELSSLIENEAGLQVVRVNEVLPQKMLTLSDPLPGKPDATVQDYLKYLIASKRQNDKLAKVQNDLHATLRNASTVKIFDENLAF